MIGQKATVNRLAFKSSSEIHLPPVHLFWKINNVS